MRQEIVHYSDVSESIEKFDIARSSRWDRGSNRPIAFMLTHNIAGRIVVAWIDSSDLMRDCTTAMLARKRSPVIVIPFDNIENVVLKKYCLEIDVVVFRTARWSKQLANDLTALRSAGFTQPVTLVIDDEASVTKRIVTQLPGLGVRGLLFARTTGVDLLISSLLFVHNEGVFFPKTEGLY